MRFKSRSRALASAALAATLGLAGLGLVAPAAQASEPTEATRIEGLPTYEGGTRYETAAEAATTAYPDGAANVVLASGEKFPDALAAGGLAGQLDAPILLTLQAQLPESTIEALADLDPTTVTIVGESDAVSDAVEAELVALGYAVDRIGGADRFETAALIAEELDGDTAVLANGLRFPDALAISPGAHELELPLLLTTADTLHEDAAAYFEANAIDTVIIVGETEVVSQAIEDQLEADGITVTRLGGDTRYETAIEIAEFHTTVGFTLDEVVLARGDKFPDALAGGPLAAQMNAPMVLTFSDSLTPVTGAWLAENCQEIDALTIMGGPVAIAEAVVTAAQAAAQCATPAAVTTRPELTSATIVGTVTAAQSAAGAGPVGTTVSYVFDENVIPSGAFGPNAGSFLVYERDGDVATGDTIVSVSGNTVVVRFTDATLDTVEEAATLTVATVDPNAVFDAQGQTNAEGDAAIGSSSGAGTAQPAGITTAPDLQSVAANGTRQGAAYDLDGDTAVEATEQGTTAVDFVFDEAAFVVNRFGFSLILTNGVEVECTSQPAGTAAAGAGSNPSGGNLPGGNGTTTITVLCQNPDGPDEGTDAGGAFDPVITAASIARGTVDDATVEDIGGVDNVLQAAAVSNGGNTTTTPDLVSVELRPNANPALGDAALFTFDQVVGLGDGDAATLDDPSPEFFRLYKTNGTVITGDTATVNPANRTQVLVEFSETDATANTVGGEVLDRAVFTANADGTVPAAGAVANQQDEEGVANTSADAGQVSGRTDGPDLTAVSIARGPSDGFGNPGAYQVTYTFDEDVDEASIVDGNFFIYLADGTKLTATACDERTLAAGELEENFDNTVVCTAYSPVVGTAAQQDARVGSAVLGTVQNGAVADEAGTDTNPEGAEFTTGGTGTPTA